MSNTGNEPPSMEKKDKKSDVEDNKEVIPYPKSVFFIVTNEFCERFSFYGLRTILVLYLNYMLGFSTNTATVIYHCFIMFAYFFPILGAIIADSWLGKFRTILYLSIVYALGNILISVTAIGDLNLPQSELTIVGLLLVALGTGGIKPCVSSFGGDQFVVPQQEVALQRFFSIFYFAINFGSFISTFLTPVLREDVHCFGENSCFFAAFGVPAVLMVVSIIAFVAGSRAYVMKAPEGNLIVEVSKCIWYAATKSSSAKRSHWLDKADDRFDQQFIEDVKGALSVLYLFIPLPIFWALFDQQGSRWTFQASRMSGDLAGTTIKPDQMQVANPVMILLFIPFFETVVYPALAKFNLLKSPLQKLVVGGTFAALSFIISAGVEFKLQETYPVLPSDGLGQLRLYNTMDCKIDLQLSGVDPFSIEKLGMWQNTDIPVNGDKLELSAKWTDCGGNQKNDSLTVYNNEATSYIFNMHDNPRMSRKENVDKTDDGEPTAMIIYSNRDSQSWNAYIAFYSDDDLGYNTTLNSNATFEQFTKVSSGNDYIIKVNNVTIPGSIDLKLGGGYVIFIEESQEGFTTKNYTVIEPNSVHMLWLVPQYAVITAGEIMFSVPGLEFSYTQAPQSMKSLITSAWLLTVAFGNLIVVIVAEAKIFDSQAYEFLLFAGLMLLDMLIFFIMARGYKYKEDKGSQSQDDKDNAIEPNGNNIPLESKE